MMILRTALTVVLATSGAAAFFVGTPTSLARRPFISKLPVSLSDPTSTESNDAEVPAETAVVVEEVPAETAAVVEDEVAAPVEAVAAEGETVAADKEAETASTTEGASAEKPKVVDPERHTLYVGNLPFSTTVQELRDIFEKYVSIKHVSLPKNKERGTIKGFAFIDVMTPDDIPKAVDALNGSEMEGRSIRVSRSLPKDQIRSATKTFEGFQKLYVGNIPFGSTRAELSAFLGEFGEVNDVFMPFDSNGSPRGFAFVSVKEDQAQNMIESVNGLEFMGRDLLVSLPLPKGSKPRKTELPPRTKLFVGNLAFYTASDTLTEVFEEFGKVIDCYIPEDNDSGRSRGFGFITMEKDEAKAAMEALDGCELDGRMIKVNEAMARGTPASSDDDEDEEKEEEKEEDVESP